MNTTTAINLEQHEVKTFKALSRFCSEHKGCSNCPLDDFCQFHLGSQTYLVDFCTDLLKTCEVEEE